MALNVSSRAILEPHSLLGRVPIALRATKNEIWNIRTSRRLLVQLVELHCDLVAQGYPTHMNLSSLPRFDAERWQEKVETIAERVRKCLSLPENRPLDLRRLAKAIEEGIGVDVLLKNLGDKSPPGVATTDREWSLILVNTNEWAHRSLFTLACLLGRVIAADGVSINTDNTDWRGHNECEKRANQFAAAFLMPRRQVEMAVDSGGFVDYADLAEQFGVSSEVCQRRLSNFEIILDTKEPTRLSTSAEKKPSPSPSPRRVPGIRYPSLLNRRYLCAVEDGNIAEGRLERLLDDGPPAPAPRGTPRKLHR